MNNFYKLKMLWSYLHHISVISKKCSSIAAWILRTFTSRDRTPMLTLFKSIVLSLTITAVVMLPIYSFGNHYDSGAIH